MLYRSGIARCLNLRDNLESATQRGSGIVGFGRSVSSSLPRLFRWDMVLSLAEGSTYSHRLESSTLVRYLLEAAEGQSKSINEMILPVERMRIGLEEANLDYLPTRASTSQALNSTVLILFVQSSSIPDNTTERGQKR